ncbi:MAG: TIM barrel protein [Verrucomicrobiota bacterium]
MFHLFRNSLNIFTLLGLTALVSFAHASNEKGSQYEIGLSMYSLRQLFESGELNVHDYPDFAKKTFGITKIDVWSGGYPKNWKKDPDFLPELKRRADEAGSEIFLVMTGSVNAIAEKDKALIKNGLKFTSAVDEAVVLGAPFVRVFLKVDNDVPEEESIRRAKVALGALADYAKSKDITIVIEPTPASKKGSGAYLAKVMAAMDHPNCKLMPDFGKMIKTDFYQGTKDMMPHTICVSAKGHDFNEDGSQKDFDYPRLMKIIREAGFTGIVAIEYEGKNRSPVEGVKAMQKILEDCNQ